MEAILIIISTVFICIIATYAVNKNLKTKIDPIISKSYSISILENELSKLEHSLDKSINSFLKKDIDKETHEMHVQNLNPKIKDLIESINILKYYETHETN